MAKNMDWYMSTALFPIVKGVFWSSVIYSATNDLTLATEVLIGYPLIDAAHSIYLIDAKK